jgi:hypothetical protein
VSVLTSRKPDLLKFPAVRWDRIVNGVASKELRQLVCFGINEKHLGIGLTTVVQ